MPVLNHQFGYDFKVDTRLNHLDCLAQHGWLSFDVTHMGYPEGYLLSPCCVHGYRAVYGPRPKQDWIPYNRQEQQLRYKVTRVSGSYVATGATKGSRTTINVDERVVGYFTPNGQPKSIWKF